MQCLLPSLCPEITMKMTGLNEEDGNKKLFLAIGKQILRHQILNMKCKWEWDRARSGLYCQDLRTQYMNRCM